jgi:hypothetical protein
MKKKKLSIRFIQIGEDNPIYTIQKKTIFGWKTLGRSIPVGFGDTNWTSYSKSNKEDLVATVLDEVYKASKKHVIITEYPMLKKY